MDNRLREGAERAVRISHGQSRYDDVGTIIGAARVIRPLNWGKNSTVILTRADINSVRPRQELSGGLDWISDNMMDATAYAIAERARNENNGGGDSDSARPYIIAQTWAQHLADIDTPYGWHARGQSYGKQLIEQYFPEEIYRYKQMASQIAFVVGVQGDEEDTDCPKGAHQHWITVLAKKEQQGRGTKKRTTGVVHIYDCKGLRHVRLAKRLVSIFKAVFKVEEMDTVRYPLVPRQEGQTASGLAALQVLERLANGASVACGAGHEDNLRRRKRALIYVLANMATMARHMQQALTEDVESGRGGEQAQGKDDEGQDERGQGMQRGSEEQEEVRADQRRSEIERLRMDRTKRWRETLQAKSQSQFRDMHKRLGELESAAAASEQALRKTETDYERTTGKGGGSGDEAKWKRKIEDQKAEIAGVHKRTRALQKRITEAKGATAADEAKAAAEAGDVPSSLISCISRNLFLTADEYGDDEITFARRCAKARRTST